jgi:hypothetical protein
MISKTKQLKSNSDGKHITKEQSSESKRKKRNRKPESLQRSKRDRLQPWIDLANLPDHDETLHLAFVRRFGVPVVRNPLERLAWNMTGQGTGKQTRRNESLVRFYRFVREVFGSLDRMTEDLSEVPFKLTYFITDSGHGLISFAPDPWPNEFKTALEGIEIARIKRCPTCEKYFYAVRANKGACDEHLARERVRRGRDPERLRQYEETRRINRLVSEGKTLAAAKAAVRNTKRKRRTTL